MVNCSSIRVQLIVFRKLLKKILMARMFTTIQKLNAAIRFVLSECKEYFLTESSANTH